MTWDRYLWGVEFTGSCAKDMPILIGEAWNAVTPAEFYGQSTRTLLFRSREAARKWCRAKQQVYSGRQDNCKNWRFRPVRVRERVEKVKL